MKDPLTRKTMILRWLHATHTPGQESAAVLIRAAVARNLLTLMSSEPSLSQLLEMPTAGELLSLLTDCQLVADAVCILTLVLSWGSSLGGRASDVEMILNEVVVGYGGSIDSDIEKVLDGFQGREKWGGFLERARRTESERWLEARLEGHRNCYAIDISEMCAGEGVVEKWWFARQGYLFEVTICVPETSLSERNVTLALRLVRALRIPFSESCTLSNEMETAGEDGTSTAKVSHFFKSFIRSNEMETAGDDGTSTVKVLQKLIVKLGVWLDTGNKTGQRKVESIHEFDCIDGFESGPSEAKGVLLRLPLSSMPVANAEKPTVGFQVHVLQEQLMCNLKDWEENAGVGCSCGGCVTVTGYCECRCNLCKKAGLDGVDCGCLQFHGEGCEMMNVQRAPDAAEETVITFGGGSTDYCDCDTSNTIVPLINASEVQKGAKDDGSALQEKMNLQGSCYVASSSDDAGEGAAVGQRTQADSSFILEMARLDTDPKDDRSASFDIAALADATTGIGTEQLPRSLIARDHPSPASLVGVKPVFEALKSGNAPTAIGSTKDDVGEFDHLILGYCTSDENSGGRCSDLHYGGSSESPSFFEPEPTEERLVDVDAEHHVDVDAEHSGEEVRVAWSINPLVMDGHPEMMTLRLPEHTNVVGLARGAARVDTSAMHVIPYNITGMVLRVVSSGGDNLGTFKGVAGICIPHCLEISGKKGVAIARRLDRKPYEGPAPRGYELAAGPLFEPGTRIELYSESFRDRPQHVAPGAPDLDPDRPHVLLQSGHYFPLTIPVPKGDTCFPPPIIPEIPEAVNEFFDRYYDTGECSLEQRLPWVPVVTCLLLLLMWAVPGFVQYYLTDEKSAGDVINQSIGTGSVLVGIVIYMLKSIFTSHSISLRKILGGRMATKNDAAARLFAPMQVRELERFACHPLMPERIVGPGSSSFVRVRPRGWLHLRPQIVESELSRHGYVLLRKKGLILDLLDARFYRLKLENVSSRFSFGTNQVAKVQRHGMTDSEWVEFEVPKNVNFG